jgi:ribose transport system ATP-binding protein
MGIVFVSHELDDVLRLADRVAILRDGTVAAAGAARDLDTPTLVRHMVGREVQQLYPPRNPVPEGPPALQLRGVVRSGAARAVDLLVRSGELVGLYGLMGAGRSELARAVFGLEPIDRGEVLLGGEPLSGPPAARIARGLAFVTEERRLDGLCLDAAVADNIALPSLRALSRTALRILRPSTIAASAAPVAASVRVTGAGHRSAAVRRLSGGNQQKVVLAKWLLTRPRVLILDEPTRGIDVGARAEIYHLLDRLASGGTGLLVVSSDLDELMGLCHRILVMRAGEISATVDAPHYVREDILRAALPASVGEAAP